MAGASRWLDACAGSATAPASAQTAAKTGDSRMRGWALFMLAPLDRKGPGGCRVRSALPGATLDGPRYAAGAAADAESSRRRVVVRSERFGRPTPSVSQERPHAPAIQSCVA